jgi:hypothetical protein
MQKLSDKEAEQALTKVLWALLIAPHNRHDHQWVSKTDLLAVTGELEMASRYFPSVARAIAVSTVAFLWPSSEV